MKKYILVVGATPETSGEIQRYLEDDQTEILYSGTPENAMVQLSRHKVILVIIELGYVQSESRALFQMLRKLNPVPILIVYANADIANMGEYGAAATDDILTGSFGMKSWMVRVKAYMEQRTKLTESGEQAYILACGKDLVINPVTRTVSLRGEELGLSTKQFDMLYFLASHPGQVLSKGQIFDHLWGEPDVGVDNSVALYISKLRKKLGEDPSEPSFIHTIRGIGYRFTQE